MSQPPDLYGMYLNQKVYPMEHKLTEGQRLYVEEEYEQALPKLIDELAVANNLGDDYIQLWSFGPRVNRHLIASIKGELPVEGQPGILELVRHQIEHGRVSETELSLLSLLADSANEGVQYITSILQDVIGGKEPDQHANDIQPYVEATKHVSKTNAFFSNFALFFQKYGERNINPKENFRQAKKLHKHARAEELDEDTEEYAGSLMRQGNVQKSLANIGVSPRKNFEQAKKLHERARESGFDQGTSNYALTFMNEGTVHQGLGQMGEKPKENFKKAAELYERSRVEGPDKNTSLYARSLLNQARSHTSLGEIGVDPEENFQQAKQLYDRARKGLNQGTPRYTRSLVSQGEVQFKLGEMGVNPKENFEQVKELTENAREAGLEQGTPAYGASLLHQAQSQLELGLLGVNTQENFGMAKELCKRAREDGLEQSTALFAVSLLAQGSVEKGLGEIGVNPEKNFNHAKKLYERARKDGLEQGTTEFGSSLARQGTVQKSLGRIGVKPKKNFEQAKQLHERARDEGLEEDTLNFAISLLNQGTVQAMLAEIGVNPRENFERAKELYERARDSGLKKGTPHYARSLMNQGNTQQMLGRIGVNPRENLRQSQELYESARENGFNQYTPDYGLSLTNQGSTQQVLASIGVNPKQNFEQAEELHERARDEGLEKDTPEYASCLASQATVQRMLARMGVNPEKNLDQAKGLSERARRQFNKGSPEYARCLMNQANTELDLAERNENSDQNYVEAEELLTEAREIFSSADNYDSLRKVNNALAQVCLSRGENKRAYQYYKTAIEAVEEVRSTVKFRDNREEFFEDYVSMYYAVVLLALELGEDEEAFEYAERVKGRIFLEMVEDTRISGDIPDKLAKKERDLRDEIGILRALLEFDDRGITGSSKGMAAGTGSVGTDNVVSGVSRSASTPLDEAPDQAEAQTDPESLAALSGEKQSERLQQAKQEHAAVLQEIERADPETHALKTVDVASVAEVQEALESDEVVVEYVVLDEEILIFRVTKEELDWHRVSMADVGLESESDDSGAGNPVREAVAEYRKRVTSLAYPSQIQDQGEVLYRALIEPIEETLEEETLLIVPHGSLHLLPFPALYDGESYLIEEYELRVLANASSLRFLGEESGSDGSESLVVGDTRGDLPHAVEEAREVADVYDAEPLIGADATKSEIEARIETADVSHLCCHGTYDAESPTHSCLLLAENEELLMEDIFNLEVEADLVTLSACQTAQGDILRGEGVQSLTRGFQYAGAPSVVGSLWMIDDKSTRKFFRKFYNTDGDTAERLRKVQIEFIRKESEHDNPFYWSAFQLYGTG